jgi:hypothetical protein
MLMNTQKFRDWIKTSSQSGEKCKYFHDLFKLIIIDKESYPFVINAPRVIEIGDFLQSSSALRDKIRKENANSPEIQLFNKLASREQETCDELVSLLFPCINFNSKNVKYSIHLNDDLTDIIIDKVEEEPDDRSFLISMQLQQSISKKFASNSSLTIQNVLDNIPVPLNDPKNFTDNFRLQFFNQAITLNKKIIDEYYELNTRLDATRSYQNSNFKRYIHSAVEQFISFYACHKYDVNKDIISVIETYIREFASLLDQKTRQASTGAEFTLKHLLNLT